MRYRFELNGLLIVFLSLICTGCQSLHKNHPIPLVSQPADVPRELCKATLPEYVIEPPDVLTIDALRLLPKQPYALQPLDTLAVQIVSSTGEPIYQVSAAIDPSGNLPLGPMFGNVPVEGKTVEEAQKIVAEQVSKTYSNPMVSVDIVQLELLQQIAGEHLVRPDGSVSLGVYGAVRVAGLSIEQANTAIEDHLKQYLDDPKVAVDVFAYNSKFYYVISEGGGLGDQVTRFPFTGNETVLDAISNVEGLSAVSSKTMWVARPGRNSQGGDQIMPVDWQAVSKRADVRTNYQILPGDRVFVAEDDRVACDNELAKKLAPAERITGLVLLMTNAVQRLVYFDRFQGAFGGNF